MPGSVVECYMGLVGIHSKTTANGDMCPEVREDKRTLLQHGFIPCGRRVNDICQPWHSKGKQVKVHSRTDDKAYIQQNLPLAALAVLDAVPSVVVHLSCRDDIR